ncbi:MAG: hypothetical protein AAF718_10970 [Pseudomonadota bacterium]
MKAAALSPVFDDADLQHLCMMDRTRAPRLMAQVDRIFEETTHAGFSVAEKDTLRTKAAVRVVEEDFLPALEDAISGHRPELCVFHAGKVFTMCAGMQLKGVIEISGTYPELKLGLEDHLAWVSDDSQRAR